MKNHNKIKTIFNDVYNNFYLKIRDMDNTVEDWNKANNLCREIVKKNNNDDFCKILANDILNEIEKSFVEEVK